ncbi:hypothetical protein DRN69_08185 [Candidatus Pacearchaeota archaeon]|nr:MAG: hypothetical protein DRN69_08185 [Candidatus Pacearchaeota archaeon]
MVSKNTIIGIGLIGGGLILAKTQLGSGEPKITGGGGGSRLLLIPQQIPQKELAEVGTGEAGQVTKKEVKATTGVGGSFKEYKEFISNIPVSSKEYANVTAQSFLSGKTVYTSKKTGEVWQESPTGKITQVVTKKEAGYVAPTIPKPFGKVTPTPKESWFSKYIQSPVEKAIDWLGGTPFWR